MSDKGMLILPMDSQLTRTMVVLCGAVIVAALFAGILALNAIADGSNEDLKEFAAIGAQVGKAEADAAFARAKADDAKTMADKAETQGHLAAYETEELREHLAETYGATLPKRKGPKR